MHFGFSFRVTFLLHSQKVIRIQISIVREGHCIVCHKHNALCGAIRTATVNSASVFTAHWLKLLIRVTTGVTDGR